MRAVDYIDLLRGSALRAGLNPDDLSGGTDGDFANLRLLHSIRLQDIWNWQEWPFLCPNEERAYRDEYNGATAYSAGAEVHYAGPGKCYQTLRSATGQAPATWNGSTWSTNLTYWAECALAYSASEYSASQAYVRGNQVYYTPTGRYYQLHAATSTGNLPTDTSYWGALTMFDAYIGFEQTGKTAFDHAFRAWTHNPNGDRRASQLDSWLSGNGLQVPGALRNTVWIDLRRRCPNLNGEVWNAASAYAVGDQAYFRLMPSYVGNFYECVTATSAGESPSTNAAKWSRVEIPREFNRYLILGAAADILSGGTDEDKALARTIAKEAKDAKDEAVMLYLGQCASRSNTRYKNR